MGEIEGERAKDSKQRRLGATFADWGIPTAECIVSTRAVAPDVPLIASGGLQNGLDAAKAIGPWRGYCGTGAAVSASWQRNRNQPQPS